MAPSFTTLAFIVFWAAGLGSGSVWITQWPQYIASRPGGPAEMHCYQNDSDYEYLYWYRQLRGKAFQLMVIVLAGTATFEEGFKSGFQAAKLKEKQWSLTISSIQEADEAVYLCAARPHSATLCQYEAYFGQGTKLTVLESGRSVTPPSVKVLPPSHKECRNKKDQKRKKTLVCVATGFYPDHVNVSWTVSGVGQNEGVATDSAAVREGKFYRITSRLRVPADVWFQPDNQFTCNVEFFNGTATTPYSDSINGETGMIPTEKYLRVTQSAKLSYGVFMVKSCIYGAFVSFLVWKLQSSAGKQKK
ncbi:M1-specific T cell receptor beta chain-like [Odontesthes bonariensis]|uniref:M1-specific T cell receptor beta chain-like n=1 Tax=Odontesthes bonariensis TaxID=219752 RepID=UPI003F58EF2F